MGLDTHELDPAALEDPVRGPVGELLGPLGFELDAATRGPVGRGGDSSRDVRLPESASFEESLSNLR